MPFISPPDMLESLCWRSFPITVNLRAARGP